MKKLFFILVFFLGLIVCPRARACDLCAVYTAINASGQGRGFYAGVAERFTHYGTLQNDGSVVANTAGQYLDSSITQLFGSYNFDTRFGLQATLPILIRNFRRPEASGIETGSVSGIGDASFLGRWTPYEKMTPTFGFQPRLLAGVKLPTGSTSRLQEELAEVETDPESGIHGHELTLGSGSWDALVGGSLWARWRRLLGTGEIQYMFRSRGAVGYRFANDLHWDAGLGSYLFLEDRYTVALQLKGSGLYKKRDTLAGMPMDDTGMTALFLGPDLIWTWKMLVSANVGADFPVLLHNTALQLVPDWRLRTAVSWHF